MRLALALVLVLCCGCALMPRDEKPAFTKSEGPTCSLYFDAKKGLMRLKGCQPDRAAEAFMEHWGYLCTNKCLSVCHEYVHPSDVEEDWTDE